MKHTFHSILVAIANGEQIQWSNGTIWVDEKHENVLREIADNEYAVDRYRVKPKTIDINGYDVPEPLREAPKSLSTYFHVCLDDPDAIVLKACWTEHRLDYFRLESGIAHYTEEAAIIHGNAILSFTKKN